jgi:hypothetical protein
MDDFFFLMELSSAIIIKFHVPLGGIFGNGKKQNTLDMVVVACNDE